MSTTSADNSVTSEKLKKIAEQYNNLDAWLYAFPTPREFLKFFSKKLTDLDSHYGRVLDVATEFKELSEKELRVHENLTFFMSRIHTLEENVHDLRTCLYDERDNYVKICAENEKLKIENEDFRRKFQAVLLMSKIDERDVTLFMQKNPKAAALTDKMVQIKQELRQYQGPKKSKTELLNPNILIKQVHALEEHLQNVIKCFREKEHGLKEEMKLLRSEKLSQKEEYDNRLKTTVSSLMETKSLLHNLVLENVSCAQKLISQEQAWIQERDKLLTLVTQTHVDSLVPTTVSNCFTKHRCSEDVDTARRFSEKQSRLETQLMEKENLLDEYKIKLIRLEKQCFRTQQISDEVKKIHTEDVKKLMERNKALQKRFEELDSRRKLDSAGFREEIRGIKVLLSALQRKFRYVEIRKQSRSRQSSKDQDIRAATAPADLDVEHNHEGGGDAEMAKESLTWEALNQLLVIAAERVNEFEQRVKLGCQKSS